jgi:hypothetical protein
MYVFVLVALGLLGLIRAVEEVSPSHTKCMSTFVSYTSSPFEKKWADNVNEWQIKVCEHITNPEMEWWLGNITALYADNNGSAIVTDSPTPPEKEWSWVFPTFTYKKVCHHKTDGTSITEYVHIPIEPTAGLARDPRKVRGTCFYTCYEVTNWGTCRVASAGIHTLSSTRSRRRTCSPCRTGPPPPAP